LFSLILSTIKIKIIIKNISSVGKNKINWLSMGYLFKDKNTNQITRVLKKNAT
jgi:hypothetical protein